MIDFNIRLFSRQNASLNVDYAELNGYQSKARNHLQGAYQFLLPGKMAFAPGEMTGKIHSFDLRVGGGYQMSLFYPKSEKGSRGKTSEKEDRLTARFLELAPNKKIVQAVNFDSPNPDFAGEMIMEVLLDPVDDGTRISFLFRNIPPGIRPEDNEAGTQSSLEKLARFVE